VTRSEATSKGVEIRIEIRVEIRDELPPARTHLLQVNLVFPSPPLDLVNMPPGVVKFGVANDSKFVIQDGGNGDYVACQVGGSYGEGRGARWKVVGSPVFGGVYQVATWVRSEAMSG